MMSFAMFWEILWALILGFSLSAVVQAVVSKEEMSRLLPDDSPRTIAIASGLGAASVLLSRSFLSSARSGMFHWLPCCGTAASALAVLSPFSSRISSSCRS
ncbi:MAG: hypothetical protein ACLP00_11235 [Terracidiphilus sp.]